MSSTLERKQFDILNFFSESDNTLSLQEIEKLTGYSYETIERVMKELSSAGYIVNGKITNAGIEALEPYRVKRAIFFAAGYGLRLAPITFNTPKPLVRVHGMRIIDSLIDACLGAGINEIYIVRGYLSEQFDQLLYKYPMIKFLENPIYNEANNISSALVARFLLPNAYVLDADLLLYNPKVIQKYQYTSNFLGIKTNKTDDWCFKTKDGIIIEEKIGGEGENTYKVVGISYWNETDGHKLSQDILDVYQAPEGKKRYWELTQLEARRENYSVEIRTCLDEDIVEIDTFHDLKNIDKTYDI